jgi:hypothetical protein
MLSVASVVKVLEVNQYRQRAAGTWDGSVVIMVTDGRGKWGAVTVESFCEKVVSMKKMGAAT